ncbi:MAG: hypothetical protein C5B55_05885 [Blastocatellia bacterium]|nr:MAG: hypothetical protein C5B55_05885 [Blastocatellia bacterium]
MSKHEDADLILKLYELRREAVMRDARNWFFTFNPTGVQDFVDLMMSDKNAYYRMVVSYWEMAATLVNHGAIDEQMFNEANGEHMFIFSKIEPFIPELKKAFGMTEYLPNLEKLIANTPNSAERLNDIRERMKQIAKMREEYAAKAKAAEA